MSKQMHGFLRMVLALACAGIAVGSVATDAPLKSVPKGPGGRTIERGEYLVLITGCHDCHTPNFLVNGGKGVEADYLTGGKLGWRGPWGTTYPANLRLYFQKISEDQWVGIAKEIQRRPPMPFFSLNAMTEGDVRAIYKYIRWLGPAGVPVPNFVPPDKEPPPPYVQFPAQ
jgi:mono/diheme cytochrome c family protein